MAHTTLIIDFPEDGHSWYAISDAHAELCLARLGAYNQAADPADEQTRFVRDRMISAEKYPKSPSAHTPTERALFDTWLVTRQHIDGIVRGAIKGAELRRNLPLLCAPRRQPRMGQVQWLWKESTNAVEQPGFQDVMDEPLDVADVLGLLSRVWGAAEAHRQHRYGRRYAGVEWLRGMPPTPRGQGLRRDDDGPGWEVPLDGNTKDRSGNESTAPEVDHGLDLIRPMLGGTVQDFAERLTDLADVMPSRFTAMSFLPVVLLAVRNWDPSLVGEIGTCTFKDGETPGYDRGACQRRAGAVASGQMESLADCWGVVFVSGDNTPMERFTTRVADILDTVLFGPEAQDHRDALAHRVRDTRFEEVFGDIDDAAEAFIRAGESGPHPKPRTAVRDESGNLEGWLKNLLSKPVEIEPGVKVRRRDLMFQALYTTYYLLITQG